jgi:carbamoylphosphate synthase small subunit
MKQDQPATRNSRERKNGGAQSSEQGIIIQQFPELSDQKTLNSRRVFRLKGCHRKLEPVKHGHVVLVKHSPEGVYQQTTRSDKKVSHNHQQHTPKPGNDRLRQQKELHQLFIALVDFGTKWQILQFCRARSLLHHLLVLVQLLQILGTIAMC